MLKRFVPLLCLLAACGSDTPTSMEDAFGGHSMVLPFSTTLSEIVADPASGRLFATDFDTGRLLIIDSDRPDIVRSLPVGPGPSDMCLDTDRGRLYIALSGAADIAVFDVESLQLLAPIRLSFAPAYVAAAMEQLYVTSTLERDLGFASYGRVTQVESGAERPLPSVGLLEIDPVRSRLYVATYRSVQQYDISGPEAVLLAEGEAQGPILELHLSANGRMLFTVSGDESTTPQRVVVDGLLRGETEPSQDNVEVFSTRQMQRVTVLPTGGWARAVGTWGSQVVVIAADSSGLPGGSATVYDVHTLEQTARVSLAGAPTSSAAVDPTTGKLYVAICTTDDDPLGPQDLQIVELGGGMVSVDDDTPAPATQEPPATQDPVPEPDEVGAPYGWLPPDGIEHHMVLIPEGDFIMGSGVGDPDEQPVHVVDVDAFYLDAFHVTVEQYRACVDAGGCETPTPATLCNWSESIGDDHPINCMYWDDADTYCRWAGLRLPTEAELEKAARCTDTRTYPWGEDVDRRKANYCDGGSMRTTPVAAYPEGVSPYGAYDMGGNVWDWVSDWYDERYYATSPPSNPQGPEGGSIRVLRGGSHWFDATLMRVANREPYHPSQTDVDIGFRCARDADLEPNPVRR